GRPPPAPGHYHLCTNTDWLSIRNKGTERGRVARQAYYAPTSHRGVRKAYGTRRSALRSEEHTSELQSRENLVSRLLLEKKEDAARAGGAEDAFESVARGPGIARRRQPSGRLTPPRPGPARSAGNAPDVRSSGVELT